MFRYIICLVFGILSFPLLSQEIALEYLFQSRNKTAVAAVKTHILKAHPDAKDAFLIKKLSDHYSLYTLAFLPDHFNIPNLIKEIAVLPSVAFIAEDVEATLRRSPNDPLYDQQWNLRLINAHKVWDFTTGGVTPLGDTIVIANMESCEIEHEDLYENIWRNRNEIPNNNIDDDNNGYIDDYVGYNTKSENDMHETSSHGTGVCGILGAVGDNDLGISGVNWNTKIMVVSNDLRISEIIEAYEYVLAQRELYNQTNGEQGAFIVATNASFGFDNRFPDSDVSFGVWCDLLDRLGEAGIVSVTATNNREILVDEQGDVPAMCPSDFTISVTNTDRNDQLLGSYSPTFIDLAAPGQGSYSLELNNDYSMFGGTSAAAPHVAGSIGLLYSARCLKFAELSKSSPAEAAQAMKSFILNGVKPLAELDGKTLTGGRLDIEGSLLLLQEYCDGGSGALEITEMSPNPVILGTQDEIAINFITPDDSSYGYFISDALGRVVQRGQYDATTFGRNQIRIDVNNFATGIYFFSIESNLDIKTASFLVY